MKLFDKSPTESPEMSESDAQAFKLVGLVWLIIGCIQIGTGNYLFALTWISLALTFYVVGREAEKKARARKDEQDPE